MEEIEEVEILKRGGGAFEKFRNAEFEFLVAMGWVPFAATKIGPILWTPPGYIGNSFNSSSWYHTEDAIEKQMQFLRNSWYDSEAEYCQKNNVPILEKK